MKIIIAATDDSEGAKRAVAFAAGLAKSTNAKLLIVNVSRDSFSSEERSQLDRLRVTEGDALEQLSLGILKRAEAAAHDHGATDIELMTGAGDPAEVLIDTVNRKHADAIVAGRRGRGRLEGLLLGSVSQKLTSLAPCAVIVVP